MSELTPNWLKVSLENRFPSNSIQRKCKCGKVFNAKPADVRRGWAKSCSKSCAKARGE